MCRLYFKKHSSNKEAIENFLEVNGIPKKTYDCYSGIYMYYMPGDEQEEKKSMYFGMYSHKNIEKLVKDFNSKFSNIKVRLVHSDDVSLGDMTFCRNKKYNFSDKEHYVIFKINFKKEYSISAKYGLTTTIAQFFRAFCPEYEHYNNMPLKEKDEVTIETVIKGYETTGYAYGNWRGNMSCTINDFMKFDNVELMNKTLEQQPLDRMPYASKIIYCIQRGDILQKKYYEIG